MYYQTFLKFCADIWIRFQYVSLTMYISIGTHLYETKLIRTEPLPDEQIFIEHY